MSTRVGIVGVSGFGGGEVMRLLASHPSFDLVYAAAREAPVANERTAFPVCQQNSLIW